MGEFLRADGNTTAKALIQLDGRKLTTTQTRTFATEEEARVAYAETIHGWQQQGYQEQTPEGLSTTARLLAIEEEITKDPDCPERYLTYAELLQSVGDPRGDLIVAQHAAERGDLAAQERAEALLKEHEDVFIGELASYQQSLVKFIWRNGFIYGIKFKNIAYLSTLRAHPSGRFLVSIDMETDSYLPFREFEKTPLSTVRRFRSRDKENYNLNYIKKVFPNLTHLDLANPHPSPHPTDSNFHTISQFPQLRSLRLHNKWSEVSYQRSFFKRKWPRLETLALCLETRRSHDHVCAEDLAPLLARKGFPALRELTLTECRCADELCEDLLKSALLPQLHRLEIAGNLTDQGAHRLLSRPEALGHLAHLGLQGDFSPAAATALRALGDFVKIGSVVPP